MNRVIFGVLLILSLTPQIVFGAGWFDLGTLGGWGAAAYGVSADGSVVVGQADTFGGVNVKHAFHWTPSNGMVDLGALPGRQNSAALGISADNSTVIGGSDPYEFSLGGAFRWTLSEGMIDLGLPGAIQSQATAVSADGSVVVGASAQDNFSLRAFRWTQSDGLVDLGTLAGANPNEYPPFARATGVSADGKVIVGYSANADYDVRAFRWTEETGMIDLGTLGGAASRATGVSANGDVIVGYLEDPGFNRKAFRWTAAEGIVALDVLQEGDASVATGISADGNVIIGIADNATSYNMAMRWTQSSGIQTISQWLAENGVDVSTAEFGATYAVSANGNTAVGSSFSGHAFVARVGPDVRVLTAITKGAGHGELSSITSGVNCSNSVCIGSLPPDSNVVVTAIAAADSFFDGWTGCDAVSGTDCTATLSASRTVSARFYLNLNTLNANTAGNGSGILSSTTPGVICEGNNCGGTLNYGDAAVIIAVPSVGSSFAGWVGCTSVNGNQCTVTMNSPKTVTANFTQNQYTLTARADGNGSGVVLDDFGINYSYPGSDNGSEALTHGTVVSLSAFAAQGSTVVWNGCDSTGGTSWGATCSVLMAAARTVTATFTLNQYSLTVNATGSGAGTVSSNGSDINFSYPAVSTGLAVLNFGSSITLTASSGNSVAGWTGACDATGGTLMSATCIVSGLSGNTEVTATFLPCTYSINSSFAAIAPAGGSQTVTATASNTGCAWTALSNAPWLTITSGGSGNGNGTVQYSVAPNTGGVRTGTITIAGQTFTVMQGTSSTLGKIGVFRDGSWYLDTDGTGAWNGCGPDGCYTFGLAGDQPVTGDWDGTGIVRMGVFRNGDWYLGYGGDGQWSGCGTTPAADRCYAFGAAGNIPVIGAWSATGISRIGTFINGTWYLDYNGDGQWSGCGMTADTDRCYSYGMTGDIPVVGDWSGTGVSKIGVFRNGMWYLDYNGDGQWSGCGMTADTDRCYSYGMTGDIPVVGDWSGDGVSKIGVFRNGMWYLDFKGTNSWVGCGAPIEADKDACVPFGMSGDQPVVLK